MAIEPVIPQPPGPTILVTGGYGFMGSNFIRYLLGLESQNPAEFAPFQGRIINVDALRYSANPGNLGEVEARFGPGGRYRFVQGDVGQAPAMAAILREWQVDGVVHFAAQTHVDRSLGDPLAFERDNLEASITLMHCCLEYWQQRHGPPAPAPQAPRLPRPKASGPDTPAVWTVPRPHPRPFFHFVSTDEVYGSLDSPLEAREDQPLAPSNPYSQSKARAEAALRKLSTTPGEGHTPGLTITRAANNYGPRQHPEKFIPLLLSRLAGGQDLPVYGDGLQERQWLHVLDHSRGVWAAIHRGQAGGVWNLGPGSGRSNLEIVGLLQTLAARLALGPRPPEASRVVHVTDRPGHDRRYALDCRRAKAELSWEALIPLEQGLEATLVWYRDNQAWRSTLEGSDWRAWDAHNYQERGSHHGAWREQS